MTRYMEFQLFPPFEHMLWRLFKTGRDNVIFEELCKVGLYDSEAKKFIREYRESNRDVRIELLKEQSDRLSASRTLPKYAGKSWNIIVLQALVDSIENGEISKRHGDMIFGHSDDESELYGPLSRYLRETCDKLLDTHDRKDLPCGNPDFITIKKRWGRSPEIVAVDAKANISALHRFYHQAYNYYDGFDGVYLATTGWIALIESESSLQKELAHLGAGLIYIDVTSPKLSGRVLEAEGACRNKESKKQILEALGWQ